MHDFPIHTAATAPDDSREILEAATSRYGFAPNLIGVMAESPAIARAYWALSDIYAEHSSLNAAEQQIVLLAVSRVNGCEYCMAAHSAAARGAGVDEDEIVALRDGRPLADGRLEALRQFATAMVESRGHPTEEASRRFESAGFGRREVLDVVLGVAYKTLSNYTNHLAETPLDSAFARWKRTHDPMAAAPEREW